MIGAGYVGLVSGACIADFGHRVTCVDKDSAKICSLNSGEIPIYEPGLKDIVQANVRQGRLHFTTTLSEALGGADAVFIAVGTPSRRGDGHADLSYVYEAAREIAAALSDSTVVITKSTVPVGTGDEVERIIREMRPHGDVSVVSNPEFLREGAAIHDFKHPDRIVIGADDERGKKVFTQIYHTLYLNQAPILYTVAGRPNSSSTPQCISPRITFTMKSPTCAKKSARMCRKSRAALGSTTGLGRNSSTRGLGLAAPAFPRMCER
jgi:UDPglucose 6-dehydrogenase